MWALQISSTMNCTKSSKEATPPEAAAPKPVDLPVLDRLERLVNTDQFADVAFRVGEVEELIFGHKVVLAAASEVFRAQFSGAFRESQENVREQAIPIVDIEPATFKEVLRYIYSDRVRVTMDNAVDIYYGADKYLLVGLKKACMQFLVTNLTEWNVLELFDRNRRYELEEVNRVCLDIICENPINAFANASFVTLAAKSVELIVSQEVINCKTDQLLAAIEKWVKANAKESMKGIKITSMVREQKSRGLGCKKMHNFAGGYYSDNTPSQQYQHNHAYTYIHNRQAPHYHYLKPTETKFVLTITSKNMFSIYGVGICIKSKETQKSITLNVNVTYNGGQVDTVAKRAVTTKEDISIEEVLFKRQTVGNGNNLTINIHMQHGSEPVYCFKNFEPDKPELGMSFTSSSQSIPAAYTKASTDCCVYYVLYNPGCGVDLKQRKFVNY